MSAIPAGFNFGLSDDDLANLASAESRFQTMRDFVAQVALGLATGCYVYGPGGCGKTYQTTTELERLGVPYLLYNSRMTGKGLFLTIAEHPDEIIVVEDAEGLLRDQAAQGVIRAATWGQGAANGHGQFERWVTWGTNAQQHRVCFTGGLIFLMNTPLERIPELLAIRTRLNYMQLDLADEEIIAIMRSMCLRGHQHGPLQMSSAECREVCDFIVEHARQLTHGLDLRLLKKAFGDYLQFQENASGSHWQHLVLTRLKDRPVGFDEIVPPQTREARKQYERQVALEIKDLPREERSRIWRDRTGKAESSLYRRLAEIDTAN